MRLRDLEKDILYKAYNCLCCAGMLLSLFGAIGVFCYYVCKKYDPLIVFIEFIVAGVCYMLALAFLKAIILKRRNIKDAE